MPTAASVTAALTGATTNTDGTLKLSPTDPGAYPMTTVIYAAVPTTMYTSTQAAAVQEYLTQLLDLTGGSESGDLPDGFAPLPTSLYQQAIADVASDVHVGTASSSPGAPTQTSTGPTNPTPTPPPSSSSSSSASSSSAAGSAAVSGGGVSSGAAQKGYVIVPYAARLGQRS